MKFADFVCPEAVRAELAATDKGGAIREMVQSLLDAGRIPADELEGIVKAILKREELGSTGIGRGVAVPHTKHPSVERLVGTVAVSTRGVDFDSLDGEVVQLRWIVPRITCGPWRTSRGNCGMTLSAGS
jgi:mannitol/fructose-specific phosphotransferase system IIA component (Ntr-type)